MRYQGLVETLRSGAWLTRGRVAAYCRIFLTIEILAAVLLVALAHGPLDPSGKPVGTDFVSFYAAGGLAADGDAASAYRPEAHFRREQAIVGSAEIPYYAFYYPPPYLLICRVLAAPPYLAALGLWMLAGAIAYALAIRMVLPERGTLAAALAFPAVFICVGHGQNALLTAAILGAATALIDRRPVMAGALLGLLCCKPQLALMVPVALLAGRRWPALAAAAASAAALCGAATLAFGTAIWTDYWAISVEATSLFESGGVGFEKMAGVFGAARLVGLSVRWAEAAQILAMLVAAAAVVSAWARATPPAPRAAVLAAASLVAAPLLLDYDLVVAAVAAAWLAVAARDAGFLPWEKTLLAVLFVAPLVSRPVGLATAIPLAASVAPAVLALSAIRLIRRGAAPG
jgi:hypothetical protein